MGAVAILLQESFARVGVGVDVGLAVVVGGEVDNERRALGGTEDEVDELVHAVSATMGMTTNDATKHR